MPHWLEVVLVFAGSATTLVAFLGVIRHKVVRPLIAGWNKLVNILERLLTAAKLVEGAAREMREFAGAFTLFAVGIKQQVDHNTERIDRVEELRELVVDLDAAVRKIERRHNSGRREGEHG